MKEETRAQLKAETPPATSGSVVMVVTDVFFSVTVRNAVRAAGFEPRVVKSVAAIGVSTVDAPKLVVVDLGAVRSDGDWSHLSQIEQSGVSVLVFGPHKDVDGFRAAKAAGVTRVVSNGQFHADMVGFISRYATAQGSAEVLSDRGQGDEQ